jgi:hypothetical protein
MSHHDRGYDEGEPGRIFASHQEKKRPLPYGAEQMSKATRCRLIRVPRFADPMPRSLKRRERPDLRRLRRSDGPVTAA